MSKTTYINSGKVNIASRKARGRTSLASIVSTMLFAVIVATLTISNLTLINVAKAEENFDPIRAVMCYWGEDSISGMMYQYTQSDDLEFALHSRSSSTMGTDNVDNLFNAVLSLSSGTDFVANNETVLGYKLDDVKNGQGEDSEKTEFNSGERLNPYDRFGVAGLQWSSYIGEWKYVMVDACNPDKSFDPKVGLYYEDRLVPQSTWADIGISDDVRTKQFSSLLLPPILSASMNTVANVIFGITKAIVVGTLALINFAFADIVSLMGLTTMVGGDDPDTGIFGMLFKGLFLPFIGIIFTFTGIWIFYNSIVRRQFRESLIALLRSIIILFIAIIISGNPLAYVSLPNKIATVIQAVSIEVMGAGVSGGNGLCATNIGADEGETKDITDGKTLQIGTNEKDFLDQVSKNMSSTIGCSLWNQFLFKPWAQGQFGTDWNNVWAKDGTPDWAGGLPEELQNSEKNAEMVGDAAVPMGGDNIINNWALFHLSTQTNVHSPIGHDGSPATYTSGVANDWWRIVDAMGNYEEMEITVDMKGGPTPTKAAPAPSPGSGMPNLPPGDKPIWPTADITQSNNYDGHSGIDFPVPEGTDLFASQSGVINYVGTDRGYGIAIFVDFADGSKGVYGHLSKPLVSAGDTVTKGQVIGLSGNTGNSTGPHLHFEIAGGGVFAQAANRQITFDWLDGAAINTTASTPAQSSLPDDTNYFLPNPEVLPVDQWDYWTGQSIWNRLLVALSSVLVALVGLIAPLIFAALSAVYAIGLELLMAFLPIMLLMAAWPGKGWEIFKSWAQLVFKIFASRIILGILLVLSIMFSSTAIEIMQSDGWLQGVIIMAILSLILLNSRRKIVDTIASVRWAAHDLGHTGEKVKRNTLKVGKVGAMGVTGGVSSKVNKGSFTGGSWAAIKNELTNQSYGNKFASEVRRTHTSLQKDAKGTKDSRLFNEVCTSCGEPINLHTTAFEDGNGSYMCRPCGEKFHSDNETQNLTEVSVEGYTEEMDRKRIANEKTKIKTVMKTNKNAGLIETQKEDYLEKKMRLHKIAEQTKLEIENVKQNRLRTMTTEYPKPPVHIRPYLDINSINKAWETETYEYIQMAYAVAWTQWFAEVLGEEFGKEVDNIEEFVKDIYLASTQGPTDSPT